MGLYLNPGNYGFAESLRSEIYVDKTGLLQYTNRMINTKQKFICVSRPRRFGKSMAAEMLVAYYSQGCDSREMFRGLEIVNEPSFTEHLNKYPVIRMDIQWTRSNAQNPEDIISLLQKSVLTELRNQYPECVSPDVSSLSLALSEIHMATNDKFVIVIDEWDCLFREDVNNTALQKEYINFLRGLFKGTLAEECIALAYITGILPIKKYGTQSALNNFREFTMTEPLRLAKYVGFTENEVQGLCTRFDMDFEETKRWYDGYQFHKVGHVYNPKSVVEAMLNEDFKSYWTKTETYETLRIYIDMNFDGLKDAVILMLGGERCTIDTSSFTNDMTTFQTKDDVLTLLIHLGYLSYNAEKQQVFIPNEEIRSEFVSSIRVSDWQEVMRAITASEALLEATLNRDTGTVAKGLDAVHMDTTSILSYNNENALSCVISLAYYSARNYYYLKRELPAGKGFADMVFTPRSNSPDKPAMIVELKWNQTAQGAIQQVKDKQYVKALEGYSGTVFLVGINYNKETKQHECLIETTEVNK